MFVHEHNLCMATRICEPKSPINYILHNAKDITFEHSICDYKNMFQSESVVIKQTYESRQSYRL